MKRSTFRISFFLKRKAAKQDGTVPILARITIDGKIVHFSTKLYVHPDDWSMKQGKAKGWDANAKKINSVLEEIKTRVHTVYITLSQQEILVTAEKVKNCFLGVEQKKYQLLEMFEESNETLKTQVGITKSKATYQKAEVCKRHLRGYIKQKLKRSDLDVREINHSFIVGFESYLKTKGGCNSNTTSKFIQKFKSIILTAQNDGLLLGNPFANYRISIKKVDRGYLTEEELREILRKDFGNERLERIRDIFIFSCYTGLAYIDIKNLTTDNISKGFDGKLWIMTKRQKTDVKTTVPLLDVAQIILKKYAGLPNDVLLPIPSNQKTNAYLKEIADVCGIKKNLTFHLARHTFATTITLSKGVPIETVSKMLGHTNIKTTQIYARITNEKISNDMQVLAEKLRGAEAPYLMST